MIKLVAFDWNGTLLADMRAIYEGDTEITKFLGLKVPSYKTFTELFDIPVKNYYLKLGASEKVLTEKTQEIEDIFHSFYNKRIEKARTRAHAKELLQYLKSKSISSIIFSNHVTEKITPQLEKFKINQYFETILANSDKTMAFKSRAKKAKLHDYLKSKNFSSNEVLIVGDTVEEIEIGHDLGIKVAAITHGNCSTRRLKAAKPDYLISSLKEVSKIIEKMN